MVGDRAVVVLEHVTRLRDDLGAAWPQPAGQGCYRVQITGEPNYTLDLQLMGTDGDHNTAGLKATAMRLVNAVPAVVQAPPGLVTALDLPLVTGGVSSSPKPSGLGDVAGAAARRAWRADLQSRRRSPGPTQRTVLTCVRDAPAWTTGRTGATGDTTMAVGRRGAVCGAAGSSPTRRPSSSSSSRPPRAAPPLAASRRYRSHPKRDRARRRGRTRTTIPRTRAWRPGRRSAPRTSAG